MIHPLEDEQSKPPTPQLPKFKRTPADFWSLVLVAGAVILGLIAYNADPADTATMFGLREGPACWLLAAAAGLLFIGINWRAYKRTGHIFTNQAGS